MWFHNFVICLIVKFNYIFQNLITKKSYWKDLNLTEVKFIKLWNNDAWYRENKHWRYTYSNCLRGFLRGLISTIMCDCLVNAEICGRITSEICGTIIDSICKLVSLKPFLFNDISSAFWLSSGSGFVKIGIRFFWALSTLYYKQTK